MSKLNPIEKSQYIYSRYKEYLLSSFRFDDTGIQREFEKKLSEAELFKGPYVALNLPFERGKSISELADEGVLCKSFLKLGDIDPIRPLYSHQEESIRLIKSGHSAVITTGTGSGKTESFLYPVLNEILFEEENGNHETGVRALFLYPMNALVNDQIDRVRKMLSKYPGITYGFFTGDTKESVSKDYREKLGEEEGVVIPDNELVSREEIRANPPHLLFTNYAMLEYLLIRPNDYSILSPEHLKNWKFVVLDEAHTYNGSLGIEISMLMRRLTGLSEKKPRFLLTSATLGKQGESENDIVDFAQKLTSVHFEKQDIIFSKRIPLDKEILYAIPSEEYIELKKNTSNLEYVKRLCKKNGVEVENDIAACLYELLCHDRHVHGVYRILKDNAVTVSEVLLKLGDMSDTSLIALIDLINSAEKNGINLFDLKYHSFVRPLSGAFITLGDKSQLSLTKTNSINGLKAFEIGNCRFCNTPYIIGKMQKNKDDNLTYLYQNKEVDIYENYGNNEFVRIDYFLLNNEINEEDDQEEPETDSIEEYILCAKCGCIYDAKNINASKCQCDDSFKYSVFLVNQNRSSNETGAYNNIGKCPCCGIKRKGGIVKSLNVGKDEGTALIAQMLFESMDDEEQGAAAKPKISLKLNANASSAAISFPKVNQFLAFSDSRQQASFAAVFLDSTHTRMLRKRLIWKVIEDNKYQTLTVDELAAYLTDIIKSQNLFDNEMSAHKQAWVTLLVDLLKVDGDYGGEGLGLYYFSLNLSDIMQLISEEDIKEQLGDYQITKADLETIIQVSLSVFQTAPAIDYKKSTLTPEEKQEYLEYRRFDNSIKLKCSKTEKATRSFMPIKSTQNMVVRFIMKVCHCDEAKALNLMDIIFNNIAVDGGLLQDTDNSGKYRINADRYIVKNYKTSKYYQCSKCGKLTPYNVHNKCVQDRCEGTLVEVDPDEALRSNYYRKQYKTKKIERIVIKEHTAQLERKEAKRYQREFKEKKINILSCSTTFEMGIDIGALETVFMRNVPPSPANYVQRAGRAGRRKDSSAYILTYCGTQSHDYTFFMNPERMISGVIRPPYFDVHNKKIIVRHLMASSLGFFFRKNPELFLSVGQLVFEKGVERFKEYIESCPDDLNKYINQKVLPERSYSDYHDFKWFNEMGGNYQKLTSFADEMISMNNEFEKAERRASDEKRYDDAKYYKRQQETLKNAKVIDSLSTYCVIPKYGFPVDLVELQVYENGKKINKYDLNRDLRIAISEYAPDSEVIVDGNKYTSKYITLPKTSQLMHHYFCKCPECKKMNVSVSDSSTTECKYCGNPIGNVKREYYIDPEYGFKTGQTKESNRMKPKRSYAGEVSYLGGGIVDDNHIEIGDSIFVQTSSDDELLVVNRSSFYYCPTCGYAEIDNLHSGIPSITKSHKNYRGFVCDNDILDQLRLGHSFKTDVARLTIPSLGSVDAKSYSVALSFMYAFLEGISDALEIDRDDIDGIIEMNAEEHSWDVLVYDNVPGGAGHVKRLLDKTTVIDSLKSSLVKVSQNCCDEDTSCYNCLRNYYNQMYHSRIKRGYAKEVIVELLMDVQ